MSPERVQRRRTKGWKMPENTVYVGRGSRWGNPWKIVQGDASVSYRHIVLNVEDPSALSEGHTDRAKAHQRAVHLFTVAMTDEQAAQARDELAGKNLACWCPHDMPCHADVLLRIANRGTKP